MLAHGELGIPIFHQGGQESQKKSSSFLNFILSTLSNEYVDHMET